MTTTSSSTATEMTSASSKRSFETFDDPNGSSSSASAANPPSPKRTRPDPDPALWDMILKLPATATQTLLYSICVQNPALSTHVREAHNARLAEEAARPPIDFDHYSQECWYTLNRKYRNLSCSKQFDAMGDICDVLSESRETILQKAGPETRYETRRNGLEVLRKICKSIALCEETQIRHEIMKDGYVLSQFAESMCELAGGMTIQEREKYKGEGLYDKLLELAKYCRDEAGMEGLEEVYSIFDGVVETVEEDEHEYEDDSHDHTAIERGVPANPDAYAYQPSLPSVPVQEPAPIPRRTKVFSIGDLS